MDDPLSPNAAQTESASDRKLREASMAAMEREGARVRALTRAAERVMESPTSLEAIAELKAVLLEQHLMSPVQAFENRIMRFLSLAPNDQRKLDCTYAAKGYRDGPHPLSGDDYAKRMRDVGRGCRLLTGDALSQHLADRMSPSTWQDILSELDATCRSAPPQLAELRELPISRQDDSLDLRDHTPPKNASFDEGGGTARDVAIQREALRAVVDGGLAAVLGAAGDLPAAEQVSEIMLNMLAADSARYWWPADRWVRELGASGTRVSKPTIVGNKQKGVAPCKAWKEILAWRDSNKRAVAVSQKTDKKS